MKEHFTDSDILAIKSYIGERINLIDDTVSWARENLKYEDKNEVLLKLKNSANTLQKISAKVDTKPVIALFGASQVGKSYLIKNLLSLPRQPFLIRNGAEEYDFLKDINPVGGAESTGVVTRFTIDQTVKYADFPIAVRLLSAKDLIIIMLDAFFMDSRAITTYISKKELESHIKNFELSEEIPLHKNLTEYDVLEIKEYFDNHLSKHTIIFEGLYESRFFERIGAIIERLDYKKWVSIFEVLWNRNEHLSRLCSELMEELAMLDFTPSAYIPFNNVLRDGNGILDVKRLKEMPVSTQTTLLKTEKGHQKEIRTSFLSALISELIFSIPPELVTTKGFLENSDLLDFPGARTRLEVEEENFEVNIYDMLLRGKVSYLFNKNTDDFTINNLLFCNNDKQLEVSELPFLLSNWIDKNIGRDQEERSRSLASGSIPPLFVVFTFFNNQIMFEPQKDADFGLDLEKLNYKWENRFVRIFENEIVTKANDWHIKWSHASPAFKNMYMLRDFNYSSDLFSDFETEGHETGIREERKFFIGCLKESFLKYPFVQKHFNDPGETWESAVNENRDGSEVIAKNLKAVSNNLNKTRHYLNLLNKTIADLKDDLVRFIHTDDITALRQKNMMAVSTFQLEFSRALTQDFNLFNELIEKLSVKSVELYNLLNENTALSTVAAEEKDNVSATAIFLAMYPELDSAGSYDEAIEILRNKMWLTSAEDVEKQLKAHGISRDDIFTPKQSTLTRSEVYTDKVLNTWKSAITARDTYENIEAYGVSAGSISFVTDHLLNLLKRRNIREKLVLILKEVISEIEIDYSKNIFLAETFALVINDLVYNMDASFMMQEEKDEIKKMNSGANSSFDRHNLTDDYTIANLFNNTNLDIKSIALEKYTRWLELLRISLLVNSGFVTYDEKANHTLKKLVESYTELQMN